MNPGMSAERWRRIETLFHAVCERGPDERAAFLDEACAGDSALRREIESLLAEHERDGFSFERVMPDLAAEGSESRLPVLEGGAPRWGSTGWWATSARAEWEQCSWPKTPRSSGGWR